MPLTFECLVVNTNLTTFSLHRMFDLVTLEIQNAQERELNDWKRLFHCADPLFELTRVIQAPEARLAIIEATWHG